MISVERSVMPDPAKLEYLLKLPWTFVRETTPEGDVVLRVSEIPSATGTGMTDEELARDTWDSLRASLETYLHFGDRIPLPGGATLPWEDLLQSPEGQQTFLVRKQVRLAFVTQTAAAPASVAAAQ